MTDETMPDETAEERSRNPVQAIHDDREDEALADAARARYRADGMVGIEADGAMRPVLRPGEQLLAVRQDVSVARLAEGAQALSGRLAITNERLFMLHGQVVTLAALEELDDVTLVTDRLLVMLTSGAGFTIEAPQPKLLRVELAAARASRLDRHTAASSSPGSLVPADLPRP